MTFAMTRSPSHEQFPLEDDAAGAVDAPRSADAWPGWKAWVETAALAALVVAAHAFAGVALPWLALAPLLAGARYGSSAGVACAAAQVAALSAAHNAAARWGLAVDAPTGQAILGWLLAGLVPGQFRDAWTRQRLRLETCAHHAARRLEGLARAYHVIAASHDQLQRELPGSPSSLRDALEALGRDVAESSGARTDGRSIDALGARILSLFRVHAAVRAATLHPVDDHGRIGPACAAIGAPAACADDPLIREAVRLGEVVSVRDLPAAGAALVAVPLIDVARRVHAVVAVHELPFLFLHGETLTLFAVLGGHFGDLMVRARTAEHAVVNARATRGFCASVSRAIAEARRHDIPSALAIVELAPSGGDHPPRVLACLLAAHRRVTDEAEIVLGTDGALRVVVLLRLADSAGLHGYLARSAALARAHALGGRCAIRTGGWSLDEAPLPGHPRALAAALASWLHSADPSEDSSTARRRHGLVA
jgi:polysaccharide biosynthesis protein PelD